MNITPEGRKALDYLQLRQRDWAGQIGEEQDLEGLKTAVTLLQQVREALERNKKMPEVSEE